MMKRTLTLILAAIMLAGCASCGGTTDETPSTTADTSAEITAAPETDITSKLEKQDFKNSIDDAYTG